MIANRREVGTAISIRGYSGTPLNHFYLIWYDRGDITIILSRITLDYDRNKTAR